MNTQYAFTPTSVTFRDDSVGFEFFEGKGTLLVNDTTYDVNWSEEDDYGNLYVTAEIYLGTECQDENTEVYQAVMDHEWLPDVIKDQVIDVVRSAMYEACKTAIAGLLNKPVVSEQVTA